MAPLGLYGAIGGKESNSTTTEDNLDDVNKMINPNLNQSKEIMIGKEEGIESSNNGRGVQHHLPFSSRSNGISTFTSQVHNNQPQNMVSFNLQSITSMAASPHINSGMNNI